MGTLCLKNHDARVVSLSHAPELGGAWDVSNDALAAGDMSGMWRLSLLTSCIAVSAWVLQTALARMSSATMPTIGSPE